MGRTSPPSQTSTSPSSRLCASVINDERLILMGLLTEVNARLQRVLGAELEASCDLALGWYDVMVRIARSPEGRLTMSEVANQTVYTSGGTTRLIDRIEEAGLVRRASCPSDRRTTYVELTETGTTALETATTAHLEHLDVHLTDLLSATERSVLIDALTTLNGGPSACGS